MPRPPYISEFPSQYWTWEGHQIHYVQKGDRGPAILLIHGFGASTDHWRKNIEILSQNCRVWAMDLMGFGRSEKPKRQYTVQVWVDQLLGFCSEIIREPVFIAGNSLGGYSSLCFAVEHQKWVEGLCLMNAAGPFSDQNKKPPTLRQKAIKGFFQFPGVIETLSFFSFLLFRRRSKIRQTLLKVYSNPEAVTDRLVEEIYQPAFDKGALGVFSSVFKSPPGKKLDELLVALEAPLSLIWGKADPWMSEKKAYQIREYCPEADLTLIDAGHCPHDESPEEVCEALLKWINTVQTAKMSLA